MKIKISKDLLNVLKKRKTSKSDSYEDVIWDLLEDTMELSDETKRNIEKARKEIREGKGRKLEDIKKELKLSV